MTWDLVVRGGRVVDGTGMRAFGADIAVKDGRIARVGRVNESAERTVDADGCWVTPGFIDVHTHYDVQLDWDPLATPSSWHGVTTALTGNCGFTLAPAKPEDVDWLAGMLSRVEGMSRAALNEGLRFSGGSFGDYWARFEGNLGINVGSYVGHCAVRRWVMGEEASEREATAEEITAMQQLVREAMQEGAIGFSTSQIEIHVGEDGRPVPSNLATPEEVIALCAVLAEFDRGAIEIIPPSFGSGYDAKDRELLYEMYRVSGRPIELNILLPTADHPMAWQDTLAFCEEAFERGVRMHPQFTTNKLELHLKLADTFIFDEMPEWRSVLTLPEKERNERLADPTVRSRLRAEFDDPNTRTASFQWAGLEVEAVRDEKNAGRVGRTVTELAAERGNADPLDTFLDLCLEEGLETQWRTRSDEVAEQFIQHVVRTGIQNPLVMPGSSDGGAHLASFTGADYTTRLLTDWVPEAITLEQAIWRNTLMPATVHGIQDRGVLREGAWADLLVIDPDRLRAGDAYLARDFPSNTERYVIDAEGYVASVVNGQVLLEENQHTGALPGHVLRGG
ncbi:MAG: amidohydrolase family protein [Myxococcota bacterium]|nr:amidohydrolase family protein [Myxococcota bacterium]